MAAGAAALSRRRRATETLEVFLLRSQAVLGAILLLWGAALIGLGAVRPMGPAEGFRIAAAAFLGAVVLRLVYPSAAPRAPLAAPALGLLAGLLPAVGALGVVEGFSGRSDLYPLALVAAAAVPVAWAGRSRLLRVPAAAPALLALVLASRHGIVGAGRPWVLLPAFLLLAAGGFAAAKERRIEGSLFALAALLGAVSLALLRGILDVPDSWQPLVLLLFAAAILHAPRLRLLRVHRLSALWLGGAILVAGALSLLYLHAHVVSREPAVAEVTKYLGLTEIVLSAIAFAAAAVSASLLFCGRGRWLVAFAGGLLAVAAVAPLNLLIEGSFERFPRPDIETALLAVGLAALAHRNREGLERVEVCPYAVASQLAAVFALFLTFAEVGQVSTPLTVFAATLAPLVLFLRRREPVHAELHAYGLLATAVVGLLYAIHGRSGNFRDAFPLLGAAVAGVLAALGVAAAMLRRAPSAWLSAGARGFGRVVGTGGVFVALSVAIGSTEFGGPPASIVVLCAVFAAVTAGLVALHTAFALERPRLAHVAVLNVLALYLYLASRTELLSFLDGYHLHALVLLGAGVYFLGSGRPEISRVLTLDGLLIPAPAVLFFVASALEGGRRQGAASSGLFLAAAVYGAAAYRRGSLRLGGLSVGLVNLALFAFWRSRGILDPAFYGVPAGLSLLASGEVLRRKIAEDARKALFVLGAVSLYGSVGVQVLRVEEPTHALVLFGLGILTVVYAFAAGRPQLQVLGTVVVVVDVLAYLLRHGFEESFLGAALLVSAGITVLAVAGLSARRRRAREEAE